MKIPKNEVVLKTPSVWDEAFHILNMKRGQARRMTYHLIIIETLRALSGKPTKDQLQKFSRIRRARFVPVLRFLIESGQVIRSGSGTKFDPFVYSLSEIHHRR